MHKDKPWIPKTKALVTTGAALDGILNEYGGQGTIYTHAVIEVEVLTVHFAKQTMRVRFMYDDRGKMCIDTQDVDATEFIQELAKCCVK